MKRALATAVAVLALAALVAFPAVLWGVDTDGQAVSDPTSISRYDADFTVDADGDLEATETIDVDVTTSDRHGIFRFFDRYDANAPQARRTPRDISVTRDGHQEPWTTEAREGGRYTVVRIGDADTLLTVGTHTYVIRYTIPGVLLPAEKGGSTFYWNVVPGGWLQSMRNVSIQVRFPVPAGPTVRCAVGTGVDAVACAPTGAGTELVSLHLDTLTNLTPVTILTRLDMATPAEGGHLPWPQRWDRVLGTRPWAVVLVGLLAVGAGIGGARLGARSREKDPPFPLVYAPPPGINPAQAAYLLRETVPRHAFIATLLEGADRGVITLDRAEEGWSIAAHGDIVEGDAAQVAVRALAGEGGTFTASRKSVSAGQALQAEIARFTSWVKIWGIESGNMSRTGFAGTGVTVVVLALIAMGVLVFWNPFGMSLVAIVPGAFAIFGFSMAMTGAGTRRTRAGRELWSQVGGFRRVLSTPSSQDRFDFSGRQELYTAYIPWAVAFDCADEWAAKYRTEVGSEPPMPSYFGGYYAGAALAHGGVADVVGDFDSTVNGAIASYAATQRSSSSGGGGGGFSGGGGGGGGGGGSW